VMVTTIQVTAIRSNEIEAISNMLNTNTSISQALFCVGKTGLYQIKLGVDQDIFVHNLSKFIDSLCISRQLEQKPVFPEQLKLKLREHMILMNNYILRNQIVNYAIPIASAIQMVAHDNFEFRLIQEILKFLPVSKPAIANYTTRELLLQNENVDDVSKHVGYGYQKLSDINRAKFPCNNNNNTPNTFNTILGKRFPQPVCDEQPPKKRRRKLLNTI